MNIENQVCTLEQAKKLKELGIIQKSYFQWNDTQNAEPYINNAVFGESHPPIEYSAFTVAELGVMLPDSIQTEHGECYLECLRDGYGSFIIYYMEYSESGDLARVDFFNISEAQVRAATLIYLLENKLTTSKKINQRLKQ